MAVNPLVRIDKILCDVDSVLSGRPQKVHFLLLGHRGWIGGQVVNILNDLQKDEETAKKYDISYTLSKVRLGYGVSMEEEIKAVQPTHVISTIGRTHGTLANGTKVTTIDYLEGTERVFENINDNLYGPLSLALLADKYDFHFTYLGTGCIFHYTLNENDEKQPYDFSEQFTEESVPNFFGSQYSVVKGFTDQLLTMMEYTKNVLNVRIRMPINDDLCSTRNLITKLVSYPNIVNIPNAMTNLDELLPLMIDMALTRRYGTIQLCNPGAICHNVILRMYKEIIDPTHEWKDISLEDLSKKGFIKAKRSNNNLDVSKLLKWYPGRVKNVTESIRDVLVRAKKKGTYKIKN